jgi:hypothetical protein
MKGLKPIHHVEDLIKYLQACNPKGELYLMPEDGEGYRIAGCLEFTDKHPQVWILIDEFGEADGEDWVSGTASTCDEGCERPGDMGTVPEALPVELKPKKDVVRIRGLLRSA